jgi:hypothetical protein
LSSISPSLSLSLSICVCVSLSFLTTMWWPASGTHSHRHDVWPYLRPKAMEPADHRLKLLNPWAKINLSSFRLFVSAILSQWQKANSHKQCRAPPHTKNLFFLRGRAQLWLLDPPQFLWVPGLPCCSQPYAQVSESFSILLCSPHSAPNLLEHPTVVILKCAKSLTVVHSFCRHCPIASPGWTFPVCPFWSLPAFILKTQSITNSQQTRVM